MTSIKTLLSSKALLSSKTGPALLITMLLVSSCSLGRGGDGTIDSGIVIDPAASEPATASDQADPATSSLGDLPTTPYVESSTRAVVTGAGVEILNAPGGDPVTTLEPTTGFGTVRVLLVEDRESDWIKVRLPTRPNHRSGWISAQDVALETVDLTVFVDLQARSLSVRSGDQIVVRSPIAIGTDANPTPLGTFYITDKLQTPEPGGAYGPFAFGLSGHSETLTEFAGGDGQIGIHGTDDPASIGQAVSHGCVRLPNDVIEELATLLPLGTPVHIV